MIAPDTLITSTSLTIRTAQLILAKLRASQQNDALDCINLYFSLYYIKLRLQAMALSIKNPEAEKLAREISKETGESLTAAITNALRDRLQRLRGRRHAKSLVQEVDDILHRVDALPTLDDRPEDEILGYDPQGLPR